MGASLSQNVKCYLIAWSIVTAIIISAWFTMILLNSPCDVPAIQPNFDLSKYAGTWYEIKRNSDLPFEKGECVTARYTAQSDGSIEVKNS